MKSFFKIYKNFSEVEKKEIHISVVLMFLVSVLEAFSIGLILPLSNMIINKENLNPNFIIYDDINKNILLFIAIFVFLIILKNIFFSYVFYRISIFCEKIRNKVAKYLFNKYIFLDYLDYIKLKPGETIRNLSSYPSIFQQYVFNSVNLFQEILILSLIILILLVGSYQATFYGMMSILVLIFLSKIIFKKKLDQLGKILAENTAKYSKYIHFSMNCIKDIKLFKSEEKFENKFNNFFAKYSRASASNQFLNSLSRFIVEIYLAILIAIVFLYLYFTKINITDFLPIISLFAVASLRLFPTGSKIISYNNSLIFLNPMVKEIIQLIYEKNSINSFDENIKNNLSATLEADELEKNYQSIIEVKNLNFSFFSKKQNIETSIRNLNFEIKKNGIFGILGKSGTGKSTLLNLICGLIKPSEGLITYKGLALKQNTSDVLNKIGYVPQKVELFDDTIYNNITMFNEYPNAEQKIKDILKILNLEKFFSDLPNNLETQVGEDGINLSGGQIQRIGIARALIKNPEIIILDEATSSVDTETEKEIINFIKSLKQNKTIIFVTHDMRHMPLFDQFINLDEVNL